jgi:uncharacterized membrane protein YfcA
MDVYMILGYGGAVMTGLILGLLGGGGALLSIPVLVYLFHVPASVATGYSLFVVAITASSGAVQNIRKKLVDYDSVFYYGLPSIITVYCMRRFVVPALPEHILTLGSFIIDKNHFILFILSAVMFGAGYKMITARTDEEKEVSKTGMDHIKLPLYAILIGSFLGLVGAGGGFLMVPALVYFANLPMRKALGTSLVLVAANSFIGFWGDVHSNPNMDWKFLLIFSAFSITGVFAGTYMQRHIKAAQLKKYFGWFVISVAVFILIKELSR